MPTLNDFRRRHIILLIGENPLPNYVSAKLLLLPGGTAHLMCSTATHETAKRLGKMLESEGFQYQRIQILDEESDGFKISSELGKHLETIGDLSIGLNYIGGTKVMAIHAYQTLLQSKPAAVFSYLNPRRLELCIEIQENRHVISLPALDVESITLEKILKLHNLKILDKQIEPHNAAIATEFTQFYTDQELIKKWRKWCDNTLKQGDWKKEKFLQKRGTLYIADLPTSIRDVLNTHLGSNNEQIDLENAKTQCGFSSLKLLAKWLDGLWLEDYVLSHVQKTSSQYGLQEIGSSLKPQDPNKRNKSPKEERFELDVCFLRGYQLFGIACTTDYSRSLCKHKLIEACLRARQLGGDEARIALVCGYRDADDLREEVSLMGDDRKIEIFCSYDLEPEDFSEKLAAWIERNIEN
ncbi:DUF1887 family protein [Leptolyngbya sp. Heron Island J]|uniref:DUF1887 family protein n=1 Tax=Leptolyngbya sp. Heron Island J TaxID=1385935 RepID=UPI0004078E73|nr:DUF1887 family protein [Leptolyngbya sp. Heron Island J]